MCITHHLRGVYRLSVTLEVPQLLHVLTLHLEGSSHAAALLHDRAVGEGGAGAAEDEPLVTLQHELPGVGLRQRQHEVPRLVQQDGGVAPRPLPVIVNVDLANSSL